MGVSIYVGAMDTFISAEHFGISSAHLFPRMPLNRLIPTELLLLVLLSRWDMCVSASIGDAEHITTSMLVVLHCLHSFLVYTFDLKFWHQAVW